MSSQQLVLSEVSKEEWTGFGPRASGTSVLVETRQFFYARRADVLESHHLALSSSVDAPRVRGCVSCLVWLNVQHVIGLHRTTVNDTQRCRQQHASLEPADSDLGHDIVLCWSLSPGMG